MCGRFNQIDLFNVSADDMANIRTAKELNKMARFGFRKAWSPSRMFLNARAEGLMDPRPSAYFWPEFCKSRCVVKVTGFLEGPEKEKLSKPYLISCQDGREFYLAGIYDHDTNSFCIITTESNAVTASIGHHRSPVMLSSDTVEDWLHPDTDREILYRLMTNQYYEPEMQVAPLNPELVRSGKNKTAEGMVPVGDAMKFE